MTVAALACAGGCILFAVSDTLTAATVGRFLIGACSAFSLVGAMAIAGQWFPAHFAILSGLAMAAGMAGGMVGQAPLRLVMEATDWRTTTLLLAGGGIALGLATWATVRDKRRGSGGLGGMLSGLATVLRHRQTWLIALAGLGTSAPLLAFAGLWGVPFLETAYGLTRAQAATLTSFVFAGWAVGAPLFGWFSDWIGRRKPIAILGLMLETLSLAAVVYLPELPLGVIGALAFLVGFSGSAQIVVFALARENHVQQLSSTAIGFVNAMVTGAGALFQPLVGFLLDLAWTGQTSVGARVYEAADYRFAFLSLIACGIGGLVCLLAVRETYCRQQA
jgi:MFS family permease